MFTLPNFLSFIRLIGIVPLLIFFEGKPSLIAFYLTLFLALTDYLDGYLARKLNTTSSVGSILDPIADKIFNMSGFILLFYFKETGLILLVLILLRNGLQLASIPILLSWKKISFKVEPKWPAKWATGFSMTMIVAHFFPFAEFIPFNPKLFNILHYLAFIPLQFICIVLETYILITFSIRFSQILNKKHDTFN
jgi:CDP-diacylglycerol--glycerol-3-phosphate 3-phosphatidyltransferase